MKMKIRVVAKGCEFAQKVRNITRKCMELNDKFPCFGWEFFTTGGTTYFTACYRNGDKTERFEFPIHHIPVEDRYAYILDQLNELKWSALFWQKEERDNG